jgi:hypothetical protein
MRALYHQKQGRPIITGHPLGTLFACSMTAPFHFYIFAMPYSLGRIDEMSYEPASVLASIFGRASGVPFGYHLL